MKNYEEYGYTNYETWNIALWISNDESLYHIAKSCRNYSELADKLKSIGEIKTPDNVAYGDCLHGYGVLNIQELDKLIKDLQN